MIITVSDIASQDVEAELLVAGLFKGKKAVEGGLGRLDVALSGRIELARTRDDFDGDEGRMLSLYGNDGKGPRRVLIVGLGERSEMTPEKLRRAFGKAGRKARELKMTHACLMPPLKGLQEDMEEEAAVASTEGFALATYRFAKYYSREKEKHPCLDKLVLIPGEAEGLARLSEGAEKAQITVDAVFFARDLVATPGADLYPQAYADIAKQLESEHVSVEVLDADRLGELGMGALLAVGQGSSHPPVLIHLSYDPGIENTDTVAIVGKGITFDSGGLDLKSPSSMRDMKADMGGSAAVMGVFKALEKWRPKCRVEGFIPAAENMPGGNAYRPGDILTAYNGLTIEIENTDAEGRLALADALAYSTDKYKPTAVIDIATLTGSCLVALGNHATGMMGTDDELADLFEKAGELTGERVWRLPLWDDYTEQLTSEIADLKNTGGRPGGVITAGAFLKEFVGDTPWIHLDIAGTVGDVKLSYVPSKKLPTGVGVRLLLEVLKRWE